MERNEHKKRINNAFYDELGQQWHTAFDHPIALLRAENTLRNPWLAQLITPKSKVLDVGCGGGFLTNYLASMGHQVSGVDLSSKSLEIAKQGDATKKVVYQIADAKRLPYDNETFDVVSAMDILEHIENPAEAIREASRVLKPSGKFFFHTFNRNLWSWLIVIKGVEWAVKNTPKNLHVYPLFIKPQEMHEMCRKNDLIVENMVGVRPKLTKPSFWKMLVTREISPDFEFCFTTSLKTGYSGYARKKSS